MRTFFFIFLLLGSKLYSQTGNYFLSHYSAAEKQSDNVCFDIIQDTEGVIYFATRTGIQQFDGRNWNLISGSGAVYALQQTPTGDILWSGANGYGKIDLIQGASPRIVKWSGDEVVDVFQTLVIQQQAVFLSEETLVIYDLAKKTSVSLQSTNLTGLFTGIFELFGTAYLNTTRSGIVKIENSKLVQSPLGLGKTDEVIFSSASSNQYLLGLSDNRVFVYRENMALSEVIMQDSAYIDASVIVSGSWVNSDLFVLGTLRGGMIFIQPSTGKTQEIINYNTGLPDNEVFALMVDKSQSIWAAHEYGFTRVSPYLPFRTFGHYPGLSGNLLCATSFEGNVYVGTSLGLFKLEKEDVYDEITFYVDVEIENKKKPSLVDKKQEVKKEADQPEAPAETESKKKGFFRFLRRNKSKAVESPTEKTAVPAKKDESSVAKEETTKQFQKVKKTERVLRTSQFVYKRVLGIDAKVTQLTSMDDRLLAVGLGGVYQIRDKISQAILEEPSRLVFASESLHTLFVSTYADEVKSFKVTDNGWQATETLENLDDQITSITEGLNEELWFFALSKVYRLDIAGEDVEQIQSIEIDNPNFDKTSGILWGKEMVIANTRGFFRFDRAQGKFSRIDSLPQPLQYYVGDGNILYQDAHSWSMLGLKGQTNLQLLNLLHNLRFVEQDSDSENFWMITGENELYKFFGEKFTPYEGGYPLLLKTIHSAAMRKNSQGTLEFDQDKSAVAFEVTQPDYLAPQSIEYRYQLKGLDKNWSDWSSHNNAVDYAYLPAGDYSLVFQSRDLFGNIKELDSLSFEVLPPYWKRIWFYALEFLVFAGLVMLSFRLSTRYRIISRILSLLTIIMLIQFIQTVIGEMFATKTSPVMDFFVQVLVAFMILPVEGYLRNLMLRSLDRQGGLYQFLSAKASQPSEGKDQEQ
jgi:hypothetical protein